MKKDLEGLEFLQKELEDLTGVKGVKKQTVKDIKAEEESIKPSLFKKLVKDIKNLVGMITGLFGFVALISCLINSAGILEWVLSFVIMAIGGALLDDKKKDSKNDGAICEFTIPENAGNILEEVYKYNKLVKNIDVLDQLQDVGHSVSLNDRENVIKALRMTREELARALKTEKILRENPEFKPDEFAINLANLKTLDISEQASEYGRLFNDTLQVVVSVQEEMKKLQGKAKELALN